MIFALSFSCFLQVYMQLRDRYIRESETHAFIVRKRGDVSQVISKEVGKSAL